MESVKTKCCSKCGIEKSFDDYHLDKRKKDGRVSQCRICVNEVKKLSGSKQRADKKYYENNKQKMLSSNKEYRDNKKNDIEYLKKRKDYYLSNREHFIDYKKSWYEKNKEQHLSNSKEWRENNKQYIIDKGREYASNRRKTDLRFKMIENIRTRVKCKIRNKSMTTESILGCDWITFEQHIENQFQEGMNWSNNGRGEDKWHYDHIKPLASAKTDEELYLLNHYTNFQPLWEKDNLKKSDKLPEEWISEN